MFNRTKTVLIAVFDIEVSDRFVGLDGNIRTVRARTDYVNGDVSISYSDTDNYSDPLYTMSFDHPFDTQIKIVAK